MGKAPFFIEPPIWESFILYKNGDDWGMLYCCFPRICPNGCSNWMISSGHKCFVKTVRSLQYVDFGLRWMGKPCFIFTVECGASQL